MPTTMGGGGKAPSSIPLPFSLVTLRSSGLRLTSGTWRRCWFFSAVRLAALSAALKEVFVNACEG